MTFQFFHDPYKPCVHVPGRLVLPVKQLLEEGRGESPLSKHLVSPTGSPHSSWHHPLLQKHFHQSMFLEAQPLLWLLLHCRKVGEKMQTTRICAFFVLLPTALTYSDCEYCWLCDKDKWSARDLGVTLEFDQYLMMSTHVSNLCKSSSFALKHIGNIPQLIWINWAQKNWFMPLCPLNWTCVIVYCVVFLIEKSRNFSVFRTQLLDWLLKLRKGDDITPILRNLHWLPVQKHIIFRILLITYKSLNGLPVTLKYLSDQPNIHHPVRSLCSNVNDNLWLHRLMFKATNYGSRPFWSCMHALWNDLPLDMRSAPSVESFKSRLKTFLFNFEV